MGRITSLCPPPSVARVIWRAMSGPVACVSPISAQLAKTWFSPPADHRAKMNRKRDRQRSPSPSHPSLGCGLALSWRARSRRRSANAFNSSTDMSRNSLPGMRLSVSRPISHLHKRKPAGRDAGRVPSGRTSPCVTLLPNPAASCQVDLAIRAQNRIMVRLSIQPLDWHVGGHAEIRFAPRTLYYVGKKAIEMRPLATVAPKIHA